MNIGFLQLARMGDWVQSLPLLNAVTANFPTAQISLLCDERIVEAVTTITGIEPIGLPVPTSPLTVEPDPQLSDRLQQFIETAPRFDWIIRCNDNSLAKLWEQILQSPNSIPNSYSVRTRRSEAVIRILPLLPPLARLHISDLWRWRITDAPAPERSTWTAPITQIGIVVGSGGAERSWGTERLLQTVREALKFAPVTLIGGVSELAIATDLIEQCQSDRIVNAVGSWNLQQLTEWYRQPGTVAIGLDTGPMQLAANCGAGCMVLLEGEAIPTTTTPVGKIVRGCWSSESIATETWLASVRRFLNDPTSTALSDPSDFFVTTASDRIRVITTDAADPELEQLTTWLSNFLCQRAISNPTPLREPFRSLERFLIHYELRATEPGFPDRDWEPQTALEAMLVALKWSLEQ